jgi:flavorubredoxin
MQTVSAADLHNITADVRRPTVLYRSAGHVVYWLGITEETAFRCNVYLIQDGDEAILVDPGNHAYFHQVRDRVAQVLPPERVTGMILCHQDPDVAASMVDWLQLNPSMRVFSSTRTHVLLPHYGAADYRRWDIDDEPDFALPSGTVLRFIKAPFLHFSGAFATYDPASRYLFSGDIWAALDTEWELVVSSFDNHASAMDLFHVDYMASNLAARGFVKRLDGVDVAAILPQHGSVIGPEHVPAALDYLSTLRCGTDILYADLDD